MQCTISKQCRLDDSFPGENHLSETGEFKLAPDNYHAVASLDGLNRPRVKPRQSRCTGFIHVILLAASCGCFKVLGLQESSILRG